MPIIRLVQEEGDEFVFGAMADDLDKFGGAETFHLSGGLTGAHFPDGWTEYLVREKTEGDLIDGAGVPGESEPGTRDRKVALTHVLQAPDVLQGDFFHAGGERVLLPRTERGIEIDEGKAVQFPIHALGKSGFPAGEDEALETCARYPGDDGRPPGERAGRPGCSAWPPP